jgi:predicted PurR-regulated permease PerM
MEAGWRQFALAGLVWAAVIIGAAGLALVMWRLDQLMLLIFAASLLAILLTAASNFAANWTGLGHRLALLLTLLLMGFTLAAFISLLGDRIQQETSDLAQRLPDVIAQVEQQLGFFELGKWLESRFHLVMRESSTLVGLASFTAALGSTIVNILIVVAAAIYFASDPARYRAGFVQLFPPGATREQVDETIGFVAAALRLWLVGQFVSMVFVGLLVGLGLAAVGLPNFLVLALIAGVLEFVPYVGPILAALPALTSALSVDLSVFYWTVTIYIAVQIAEMILIVPLVQRRAVDLPPPLTLFSVIGFGVLFGGLGIFLAAPLTVTAYVLVKKLWVREIYGEETTVPGDGHATAVTNGAVPDVSGEASPRFVSAKSAGRSGGARRGASAFRG